MTVKLKAFGKMLVTRQDAKNVLQVIDAQGHMPILDFAGVKVANHPFADELGKGLAKMFDLSKIRLAGANAYVRNSVEAGFMTAVTS